MLYIYILQPSSPISSECKLVITSKIVLGAPSTDVLGWIFLTVAYSHNGILYANKNRLKIFYYLRQCGCIIELYQNKIILIEYTLCAHIYMKFKILKNKTMDCFIYGSTMVAQMVKNPVMWETWV